MDVARQYPAFFAQIRYGITEKNNGRCPDLQKNTDGTYTCRMIGRDDMVRYEFKGTGCHYPKYRIEKSKKVALILGGKG